MIGRGLNGSAQGYILATCPLAFGAVGSSAAFDLSQFESATLVVAGGSIANGFQAVVQRSATSDGSFGDFGASVAMESGGTLKTRTFVVGTSATWHKVYRANGVGSAVAAIIVVGHGARSVPITQHSTTTVHSDVAAAK